MNKVLKLDKLSVSYGRLKVVNSLSLDLAKNQTLSLIGPNGCGKSTIIKAIAGITGYSGTITSAKKLSYLPQQDSLMPWLRALDNILLPARLRNIMDEPKIQKAKKYLNKFGLANFSTYYPHQLSGGMRQKLALIRTVLQAPDLVLIDEPFSSLDAITRLEMHDWLNNLKKQEKFTCLLVTHDINEAINLSDRIVALSSRPATIIEEFSVNNSLRDDLIKRAKLENRLKEILINEKA